MCRTMQKLFSSPVVRSLAAVLIFGLCCNGETPERCLRARPTESTCDDNIKVKKFFFNENRGRCRKFLYCPQDEERFDNTTTENYFLTREECECVCPDVTCPELHLANGYVNQSSRAVECSATYHCHTGFSLVGTDTRVCQSNGTWSGDEPSCQAQCPDLTPVRDAEILSRNPNRKRRSGSRSDRSRSDRSSSGSSSESSESNSGSQSGGYIAGHTVIYRCAEGLILFGDAERTCLENGTWSGSEPYCDVPRTHCPVPPPIDNGRFSGANEECLNSTVGCNITYTCNDNYTLVGSDRRTCLETGEWSSLQPICAKIRLDIGGIDVSNTEYIISEDTRDVSITCQMVPRTYPKSGSPVWRFVLNSMDDHGFRIVGNTIKFDSIQNNHNGNYTCCIGELSASVVIHVQDETQPITAPALSYGPAVIFSGDVSGDDQASLYCVFSGCPGPVVTWLYNDTLVSSNETNRQIESYIIQCQTLCRLIINSVNEEGEGGFKCVGRNVAGTAMSEPVVLEPSERRKRSADGRESSNSLCSQDPESVTLVGRIRRQAKALKSFHSLGVRVERVIRGTATGPLSSENKRITVFLHQDQKAERLKKDTTVIVTGRIINDKLFIFENNSIQPHSPELENLIKTC